MWEGSRGRLVLFSQCFVARFLQVEVGETEGTIEEFLWFLKGREEQETGSLGKGESGRR